MSTDWIPGCVLNRPSRRMVAHPCRDKSEGWFVCLDAETEEEARKARGTFGTKTAAREWIARLKLTEEYGELTREMAEGELARARVVWEWSGDPRAEKVMERIRKKWESVGLL